MSSTADVQVFWGELAPCDHLVQIYSDDAAFLDALEGFVAGGLRGGEAVILIVTRPHRLALEARLSAHGLDLPAARSQGRYIPLDAEKTLRKFMVRGWPDEELFEAVVAGLLERAAAGGRRVRAFGEMVALLWANGQTGATVRLEHLWHRICERDGLSLFCAYPRSGFTQDAESSLREICEVHTRVIPGR